MIVILRQTIAIPALAALALTALAGCGSSASNSASSTGSGAPSTSASSSAPAAGGGSGSNVGLSDSALRTAFTAATKSATAMHIAGTLSQQGQSISMDLNLNKDNTSQGTISIGTAKLQVKAVGGVDYIQLSPSFLQYIAQQEKLSASQLSAVANKWLSSNSSEGKSISQGFDQFMSFTTLTGSLSSNAASDPATAAGTKTLNGQTVAYYTTKQGSKLYFAATGPAYLLREDDSGSEGTGTVTIVWNQPTTVTAPPASDITDLPTS